MTFSRRFRFSGLAVALTVVVSLMIPGLQGTASAAPAPARSATSVSTGDSQLRAGATAHRSKKAKKRAKARAAKKRAKIRAAKIRAAKIRAAKARAAKAKAAAAAKAKAEAEAKARAEAEKNRPVDPAAFRLADANLKFNMDATSFAADLSTVLASGPDAVTLNEVAGRSTEQLTPAGYGSYRPTDPRIKANAVLWRSDRWAPVAQGQIYLIDDGPSAQDWKRGATWVTLNGLYGQGSVSVVSTHHMINPAKFGPDKPLRQQLYAEGMGRLKALVDQLAVSGPVYVAGDFNSGFYENRTWSPRVQFAPQGIKAAMETMPHSPTHDAGGTVDYVFYQSTRVSVTSQTVVDLLSDHHLLLNDFTLLPPTEVPPGNGNGTSNGTGNGTTGPT